jgi:xanthine dehydrogenase accessory factor
MKKVFPFIKERLSRDIPVMLMTVIQRNGSSPGKVGFKMAVAADGEIIGSIGGGTMEHVLVERAKKQLQNPTALTPYLLLQDHDPDAKDNRSGMICSGSQYVAFLPLEQKDLSLVEQICSALDSGEKAVFQLSPKGMTLTKDAQMPEPKISMVNNQDDWEYREQMGMPDTLYIFGGGHVGLAVSRVFRNLGFYVKIFDNRENINTLKENTFAHEKQIVDYKEVGVLVPDGFNVYVVIVTFSHKSDQMVLWQMLGKKIKYLGMMGSEMKVKTIFEKLREESVPQEQLDRVFAPIGLAINSASPEEVAVSIAAQIISVKNGQ